MIVHTESGNTYTLKVAGADYDGLCYWRWTVKEARDLDTDGKAGGVVIHGPQLGKSLTLAWVGPDGRLKVRITSPIVRVEA